MKHVISLIRPNNWVKNLIVILPAFFAAKLLELRLNELYNLGITFLAFCCSSSLIYVINDVIDQDIDRLHPKKSKRPIASGNLNTKQVSVVISALVLCIIITFFFIPQKVIYFVFAYIIMNLIYCFGWKNVAIVDIVLISLGFVFRVMAGGEATNTFTSHWIIILIFLLMFSIAIAKRRDDLILSQSTNELYRKSQTGYTIQFIDIAKTISFSVTLVAYIIYSVSNEAMERMGSNNVYITSLPVFLGIMRYIQLTIVYKKSGSPVDLLLRDKLLISSILLWIVLFITILYV